MTTPGRFHTRSRRDRYFVPIIAGVGLFSLALSSTLNAISAGQSPATIVLYVVVGIASPVGFAIALTVWGNATYTRGRTDAALDRLRKAVDDSRDARGDSPF